MVTGYNGIFNVTNSKIKFLFKKSIIEEDFIQIRIPEGADEIECLNNEIKRILIDEDYYTEANYPITIKPNFSNLGSIIEINPEGNTVIGFVIDDSIGSLLGFDETILYKENNLSPNPVDILSSDNIFLECDVAQGMIYRGKKSTIFHNWTMIVDPGNKYVESFAGGITWYMMENKDIISSIHFELKNEKIQLVSFNGPCITFRLSIKERKKAVYLSIRTILQVGILTNKSIQIST